MTHLLPSEVDDEQTAASSHRSLRDSLHVFYRASQTPAGIKPGQSGRAHTCGASEEPSDVSPLTLQILLSSVLARDFPSGFLSCWNSDLIDSWHDSLGSPSLALSSCCWAMKPCEVAALTALGMGRAVCTGLVPTADGGLSLEATPTTGMVLPRQKKYIITMIKQKNDKGLKSTERKRGNKGAGTRAEFQSRTGREKRGGGKKEKKRN